MGIKAFDTRQECPNGPFRVQGGGETAYFDTLHNALRYAEKQACIQGVTLHVVPVPRRDGYATGHPLRSGLTSSRAETWPHERCSRLSHNRDVVHVCGVAPGARLLLPVVGSRVPAAIERSRRLVVQHVATSAIRPAHAGALKIVAANLVARIDVPRLTWLQTLLVHALAGMRIRTIPVRVGRGRLRRYLSVMERRSGSAIELISLHPRSGA